MRAHFCWNSENKHWGWHELVFSTCFMRPFHLEMSIQERKCKFSKTVNFTEHPVCARHYTRARDLKTRTWAPARCLGNGCWLCCCETGREKESPLSSCKIAQHLWVVSWSEHLLFQTRDGKATMRASESHACCWGCTILTNCETWPIKGWDSSTISTATCPVFSLIPQQFLRSSGAKLGMWFVLS